MALIKLLELRRFVFESLILEGRKEDVLKKYPSFASEIEQLISEDPSNTAKYLMWSAKMLDKGESVEDVIDVVNKFHVHSGKLAIKMIDKYDNFDDLKTQLDVFVKASEEKKQKAKQKFAVKDPGADIIVDDDRFVIRYIKNHAAAVRFGARTKWCITTNDEGGKKAWAQYDDESFLFFLEDKNKTEEDPLYKIAILINNDLSVEDCFNSIDKTINFPYDDYLSIIKSYVKTNLIGLSPSTQNIINKIDNKQILSENEINELWDMYRTLPEKYSNVSSINKYFEDMAYNSEFISKYILDSALEMHIVGRRPTSSERRVAQFISTLIYSRNLDKNIKHFICSKDDFYVLNLRNYLSKIRVDGMESRFKSEMEFYSDLLIPWFETHKSQNDSYGLNP